MGLKISEYVNAHVLPINTDLYDVSADIGAGSFESRSVAWSVIKSNVDNMYKTDGTLAGNRIVSMGVNDLTFGSTADANQLIMNTASGFVGVGVPLGSINAKLHVAGNVQADGDLAVNSTAQGNPLIVKDYLGNDMINVLRNASSKVIKIGDIALNMQTIIQGVTGDVFVVTANGTNDYCHIGGDPDADAYLNLYRSNVVEGARISLQTDSLTDTYFDIIANFGIGTTTPSEKLDVVGAVKASTHYKVGINQVVGAQEAAVIDATDAASAITQLNALLARVRSHGLIAA